MLLAILLSNAANAANLYRDSIKIRYDEIDITLSDSLYNLINHQKLKQAVNQINKLPINVPKIRKISTENGKPLADTFKDKINKVFQLSFKSKDLQIMQVHVAYEPNENYGLSLGVAEVWATNTGLILINDKRLKQVAGEPVNQNYLVNTIIHELLHIYGLDHATIDIKTKNVPVMNLGKFAPVGLSHDDIAGLLEKYDVTRRNRKTLTVFAKKGSVVVVQDMRKKTRTQGKIVKDEAVVFPQVLRGRYWIYENGEKIGRVKLNRNKVFKNGKATSQI